MFDFVKYRYVYFIISAALLIPGVISLALPGGLRPGIDFTSGSIMTLGFEQPVDQGALRQAFANLDHGEAIVQRSGTEEVFIVRTKPLEQPREDETGAATTSERTVILDQLRAQFGAVEMLAFDHISPLIATEIVWKSVVAVAAACVFILLYLWWAFRRIPQAWRYGSAAVVALVHDALIVLGAFSILGRLAPIELDAMFITAVLTVIGYSVHDTIVVFDRVRENFVRHAGESLESIVNHSLTQTMTRSLNTSVTVLLVLVALLLFGGVTIRSFVLALLIGITAGTYSSIFFASMLLVVWEKARPSRTPKAEWRMAGAAQ